MRFAQEISKSLEIPLGEYRSGILLLRVVLCKEKGENGKKLRCRLGRLRRREDESLAKAVGYGGSGGVCEGALFLFS